MPPTRDISCLSQGVTAEDTAAHSLQADNEDTRCILLHLKNKLRNWALIKWETSTIKKEEFDLRTAFLCLRPGHPQPYPLTQSKLQLPDFLVPQLHWGLRISSPKKLSTIMGINWDNYEFSVMLRITWNTDKQTNIQLFYIFTSYIFNQSDYSNIFRWKIFDSE